MTSWNRLRINATGLISSIFPCGWGKQDAPAAEPTPEELEKMKKDKMKKDSFGAQLSFVHQGAVVALCSGLVSRSSKREENVELRLKASPDIPGMGCAMLCP